MIGEVLGGYRIVARLGQGAAGEVFAAEHASVGTKAAIKVITPALAADPGRLQRFLKEAQTASRIGNQGTVKITDVGMPAGHGHGFIVMEHLHGETLAKRIERSTRLSLTQISEFGRQLATIVAAIHDENLVHRDLRPDKIFLVRPDSGLALNERMKVLVGDTVLLGPGHEAAAPYTAPELWRDPQSGDWRVDVYAFGCMIFEMATGQKPYSGSAADLGRKHTEYQIPAARSIMPDVPPVLDALIARLMGKQVDQRPKSMREIARELETIGGTAKPLAPTVQDAPVLVMGEMSAATLPGGTQPSIKNAPKPKPKPVVSDDDEAPPKKKFPLVLVLGAVLVVAGIAVLAVVMAGCLPERHGRCDRRAPGDVVECKMPSWLDRSFELRVPSSWDGSSPLPIAVLIHGGGGNRAASDRTTCPDGDTASPRCFSALALARGYAVVIPDGTGSRPTRGIRTWNAGGGGNSPKGELDCVSGQACSGDVDDVRYFLDLLGEVNRAIPIDQKRIYATGISNGGGMSHRIACQLGDRFAAVVSVAGGNQYAFAGGNCPGGAAVMELHGTKDLCWPYEGGGGDCISNQYKVSVEDSMTAWAARNGCDALTNEMTLPDTDPTDNVTSTRKRWVSSCKRATEIITSEGAGHTWPSGYKYLDRAGQVTRDFGSEVILDFFDANPRS